jgi:Dicarboxylate transport
MRYLVRPCHLKRWLMASCCLAAVGRAADRPAWLVVGPWEAQIEASVSGADSALRVVVPRLRATLDLDQPAPLTGSSGSVSGAAPDAGAAPAIDLPPLVKSLRVDGGELVVKRGGQTQIVNWHAELTQPSPGVWRGSFTATGEGIALTASVTYETEKRVWQVPRLAAQLDLARWSGLVLPGFLPKDSAWTCAGSASLEAALSWTPAGLDGTAEASLHGASASRVDGTISAAGIEAAIRLVSVARLASAPAQRLTVRELVAGKIRLTALTIDVTCLARDRIAVEVAAQAFGGKVRVEPFEFNPTVPNVRLEVAVDGVDAQGVLALFPEAPQGQGALVGRLPLRYENGQVGFGEGQLRLKPGTTGRVRFHHPGLFTQAWAPLLPGRKLLGEIESGQEELVVSELGIALHPAGSAAEHSAEIRIVGVPADHPHQGPFTFDFNLNAPLESFMNFRRKPNMRFDFK